VETPKEGELNDRYYIVTFDLEESKGQELEYNKIRQRLEGLVGKENYFRPVKQCCIVKTPLSARHIRNSMLQTLGPKCNILVVRLRFGYAFRIKDVQERQRTNRLMNAIPR
jgi:hypothetical protein